jgi:drug/metabolite transporter (DMT)-like permease
MQKRMFGNDSFLIICFFLGLPLTGTILALFLSRGFNFQQIIGSLLSIFGAFLIIQSKFKETNQEKFFKIGPPALRASRIKYFIGYILYVTGIGILL